MEENDPFSEIPDSETTCRLCYAEFLDPEDLDIHVKQMHPPSKCCQLCFEAYSNMEDYAIHIRDTHLCSLKYCDLCARVFLKLSEFRQHVEKHSSSVSKMFKCSQCSETFNNTAELESHEYNYHLNANNGAIIKDCYKELSSVLNINASTFLKSLSTKTVHKCTVCSYTSVKTSEYIKHIQKNKCQSKVCDICSNVFKNKSALSRHISKHRQYERKSKQFTKLCTKCNKNIHTVFYSQHRKQCKPIQCITCSMVFETLPQLSEHQMKVHPSSLELVTCKFCNRECVGEAVLKKHIDRIHKNQFSLYKYLCVYCKTPFKHPKNLFGHFFTKHKDINPYTCKICDTTFRVRKGFTIHIKIKHDSKGFVEFDENYHVFFTDKKSEKPFQPQCVLSETNVSDDDGDNSSIEKGTVKQTGDIVNLVDSDFMDPTETEGNQTEREDANLLKVTKKRKLTKIVNKLKIDKVLSSSDDDEPLVNIKKRSKQNNTRNVNKHSFKNEKGNARKRKLFTCKKCKKYCYTYQNYNNHMSLHSKHEVKKCIKCLKEFNSKADLQSHMAKEHKTSRLTETLKNLLEKRKSGVNNAPELTMSQKFQKTVRKVVSDNIVTPSNISIVPSGLSVQKFIENFTPEVENTKKTITIDSSVSVKTVNGNIEREPLIKMMKYKPKPSPIYTKLAMPVKFKDTPSAKAKLIVKLVDQPITVNSFINSEEFESNANDYSEDLPDMNDAVPDVAEEVLVADKIKPTHDMPKIVIPKLPKGYKDIHIAHLLPEAPFFKIVRVKESDQNIDKQNDDTVKLPDGTKLVTVNPLAHLLGDKPVEELLKARKNKYYQPKQVNFEKAVVQAMQKIKPRNSKKKQKKKDLSMPILPVEQ